jgi:hypothetical protein
MGSFTDCAGYRVEEEPIWEIIAGSCRAVL